MGNVDRKSERDLQPRSSSTPPHLTPSPFSKNRRNNMTHAVPNLPNIQKLLSSRRRREWKVDNLTLLYEPCRCRSVWGLQQAIIGPPRPFPPPNLPGNLQAYNDISREEVQYMWQRRKENACTQLSYHLSFLPYINRSPSLSLSLSLLSLLPSSLSLLGDLFLLNHYCYFPFLSPSESSQLTFLP